jgi:exopolysaccharide production protein ExoZ
VKHQETVLSIQYLRAVAAIAVVIFHASNNEFQVGMAGVDVFFVISGFIMWTTTIGKPMSPAEFMSRRLTRIVPLYWAMTLFTALITISPPKVGLAADAEHLVRSLLFLPANIVDPGHPFLMPPVLGVGWTLNLEMYFYIVFALALMLPARERLAFIGAVIATPVILGVFIADQLPLALRFYTRPELLEFIAGVALGAAYAAGRTPHGAAAAVALLTGSLILFATGQPAIDFRAAHFGAPALLLCVAGIAAEGQFRKRPNQLAKLLGDASYSIYLAHIPMLTIARKVLGWPTSQSLGPFELVFLSAAAVAGCVAVYLLFEKPVDRALRRFLSRRRAITRGAKT